jgi:superfamily II DNA or RNA helicase
MTFQPRPYQLQMRAETKKARSAGARYVLNVLSTGGGKTPMLAMEAMECDGPSCTIVHRQELLSQISETYAMVGLRHNIIAPQPVISAIITRHVRRFGRSLYDPRGHVAVAGVDTLIRRHQPGDRWCNSVRLWLLDEAHHGLGLRSDAPNKWGKAAQLFPNALGFGVTATPLRADKRSLHVDQGGMFDALVQGPGMRDLIEMGALCPYRVIAPQAGIDEALLRIGSTGDFTAASTKAARKAELTGDIVATYLDRVPSKKAIVFTTGTDASRELEAAFIAAGVRAKALDANTNDTERQRYVDDFGGSRLDVLINTGLFDEGFDVPSVEVVIMARPTMSYGLFAQQIGRALRPAPGKSHGTIIDHVGNVVRMAATHGLPDTPRRWPLWVDESRRQTRDPDAVPVRVCPSCALVYEALSLTCPYCGHRHVPTERGSPQAVDGILTEMSPELLERLRMAAARHHTAEPLIPVGADERVVAGIRARHRRNQAAQASLADAMQQWGGVRLAAGDDDTAMQARFLHRFGVDVLSAQGLPERAALELRDAILEALT